MTAAPSTIQNRCLEPGLGCTTSTTSKPSANGSSAEAVSPSTITTTKTSSTTSSSTAGNSASNTNEAKDPQPALPAGPPPSSNSESLNGNGPDTGEANGLPFSVSRIQWQQLTPQSQQTLRQIAVPIYAGYSESEIATHLGQTPALVRRRLTVLRSELLAQQRR